MRGLEWGEKPGEKRDVGIFDITNSGYFTKDN